MKVIPYMSFEGTAEVAMTYYADALDGEIIYVMRYKENKDYPVTEAYGDKLMHAQLKVGNDVIYVSDVMENVALKKGSQVDVNINFDSVKQLEYAYKLLSVNAEISMPLADTFWNAKFASLVDQFGIGWSLNYSYPEKK